MKISVSSYSFQQYISGGKMTQAQAIEKANQLGIEAVEFTELMPCEKPTLDEQLKYAEKIRKNAESLGVEISSYVIGANMYQKTKEDDDTEVKRVCDQIKVANALGAKIMRHDICFSLNGKRSFDAGIEEAAENARKITEFAKTLGIKTCSENHGYIAQDSERMERFFNAVNHENYGLLTDFGNFACVDEDSAKAVSRLAPYAILAHAKDFTYYSDGKLPHTFSTRGGNYLRGMIIGYGDIPVKRCLQILKNQGYDGYVVIEFEGIEDCMLAVKTGAENLRRYISELN